jgi:flagellar operon protein
MANINGVNGNSRVNSTQRKQNSFQQKTNRANFNQLFQQQLDNQNKEVKISAHAEKRMQQRNITLSDADMQKISESMDKASAKGANDALMIYDDLLMIASVQNRTIITTFTKDQSESEIITNVDSAIFVK